MEIYEYVVVRYLPDEIRKEQINIGVLLRDKKSGKLYHKFYDNLNRLQVRFPFANLNLIYTFISSFDTMKPTDENFLHDISENFSHQIQFSEVMVTFCENPRNQIEKIYKRFVSLSEIPQIELVQAIELRTPNNSVKVSKHRDIFTDSAVKYTPEIIARDSEYKLLITRPKNLKFVMDLYRSVSGIDVEDHAFAARSKKKK